MKLYVAFKDAVTLMEGSFQYFRGVFDSREKAWKHLETTIDFNKSEWNKFRTTRVYHLDGELSYHWYVKEVELNNGVEQL